MAQETNWRRAQTAGEALESIRQHSSSDAEKGLAFEALFSVVAQQAAELEVKAIYKLSEWAEASKYGLDGRDIGVDRVAILHSGERIAVQCKCYEDDKPVQKADVQSFLAGSQNEAFDLRWLVTTSDLTGPVSQMLKRTNIRHLNFHQYSDTIVAAEDSGRRAPFPLQQQAIDAVIEGFGNQNENKRGQLIMACGTGKTFTALRIAEQLVDTGGRILFLAPSIALVAQARKEWLQHTSRFLRCTVVCSDKSVRSGDEGISVQELSFSVTTNAAMIAAALRQDPGEAVSVVFCTYQSLPQVIRAQKQFSAPHFDLALVDEAHRTAGIQKQDDKARVFQLIHHQQQIQCDKRLYMTATPRIYGEKAKANRREKNPGITITDMSDTEIYGHRFFRLTFRQAVSADMLCDVRVICLGLPEDALDSETAAHLENLGHETQGAGKPPEISEYMSALVIGLALNGWIESKSKPAAIPRQLPRTLAYANTIRRSKWLASALISPEIKQFLKDYKASKSEAIRGDSATDTVALEAKHLDASHSAYQRSQEITRLNTAEIDNVSRIITNCRLFSEGVDVPALSSVAFMDPKSSEVEIVQSIGRVMRKAGEDKKMGYILVPIALLPGKSMSETLEEEKSRFAILGKVLRALQSHDEKLYSQLASIVVVDEPPPGVEDEGEEYGAGSGDGEGAEDDETERGQQIALGLGLKDLTDLHAQLADYSGLGDKGKLVADIIIAAVKRSARIFREETVDRALALLAGSTEEFLAGLDQKDLDSKLEDASHTASLVICNACLMHKRLETTGNLGELNKLERMGSKADVLSLLLNDWKAILQKDYQPIFQQAFGILQCLQQDHGHKVQLQAALQNLINCAVDTAESLNELGYDHAGPLYHRILDNAASQGAYYTDNRSALLMGQLVFDDDLVDWADKDQVGNLRVIDPCCGTGTLLMAGLNTIKERAAKAQQLEGKAPQALHKSLVENCIYGLDITSQAIQLAACNLTLGAPDTTYEQINMYALQYGMASGENQARQENVRQGTLELLAQMDFSKQNAQDALLSMQGLVPSVSGTDVNRASSELNLPGSFDVVMMNPPYTDTSRQKNQFPQEVGDAMAKRLRAISSKLKKESKEAHSALAKMSVRPFFTPLVAQLVAEGNGTLAKFIPTTALTSNNGLNERKFLASHFHIETVITSHAHKNIAFSDSTDIYESLLIARRKVDKSAPTRFIQLARMPGNVQEVNTLTKAIQSDNLGDWGSETLWSAERVQAGDWSRVQWYSSELIEAIEYINQLDGLEKSGDNYSWGSSKEDIRHFDNDMKRLKTNAYCTTSESKHQYMASPPDTWVSAKKGHEKQAQKFLARSGHILVPCRIRTTNCRIMAVHTNSPCIGSAFIPIDSAQKIPVDKAASYAVFLNSTFGILQLLNKRTSGLDYFYVEKANFRTLLLPSDVNLDWHSLVDLFKTVCKEELLRLSQAHEDPIRRQLDHAVAELLGVDPALTDKWRELLAKEPTISNKEIQEG